MNVHTVLKEKIMEISRSQKEKHFYSLFKEGMTVLDVGVSSETRTRMGTMENHFSEHFQYPSQYYVGWESSI